MQTYAEVVSYAIPFFVILLMIEYAFSRKMHRSVMQSFDAVSSLSSGVTNSIKDVLGLVIVIVSYTWLEDHLSIFHIENTFLVYFLAFIGIDFVGYWSHRFEHEINIFWNRHIIHHSSEEYNLACALRQNISVVFSIFFFLYIPMALLGVPADVVAVVAPLHLFAQFWYHTRLIDKMGFLEYIIVTPSHHRVHHAINPEYIDKNYAQILIIWDKLFGTFQEELVDVPPVYGVKKPVRTWNPIWINFQHLYQLAKDAFYTEKLVDKLRIWIMPTGWRPQDRLIADPISYDEDPFAQIKYETPASLKFHIWVWLQLVVHIALMLYLFLNIEDIGATYSLLYGVFLVAGVGAYTSLMDRSAWTYFFISIQILLAVFFVITLGGWFGLSVSITSLVAIYLAISLLMTIYFMKSEHLEFSQEGLVVG